MACYPLNVSSELLLPFLKVFDLFSVKTRVQRCVSLSITWMSLDCSLTVTPIKKKPCSGLAVCVPGFRGWGPVTLFYFTYTHHFPGLSKALESGSCANPKKALIVHQITLEGNHSQVDTTCFIIAFLIKIAIFSIVRLALHLLFMWSWCQIKHEHVFFCLCLNVPTCVSGVVVHILDHLTLLTSCPTLTHGPQRSYSGSERAVYYSDGQRFIPQLYHPYTEVSLGKIQKAKCWSHDSTTIHKTKG